MMSTQAILITAYADFPQLERLVGSFDDRFDIYVHMDRKAPDGETCCRRLRQHPRVRAAECVYAVNWGSRRHVDAILWLCRQALEGSPCAGHFHLVSGADLPVRTPQAFCDFFAAHAGKSFMELFSLPTPRWHGGGWSRMAWRHPLDRLNLRDSREEMVYARYMRRQLAVAPPRPLPAFPVYGGSSWWSLSREAVAYVCAHSNWNGWYDRMADTFASDEVYVQTLLMNSPLRPTLVNRLLRYIVWENRNGSCPAVLDETDFPAIEAADAFFARKVDSHLSAGLIARVDALCRGGEVKEKEDAL